MVTLMIKLVATLMVALMVTLMVPIDQRNSNESI